MFVHRQEIAELREEQERLLCTHREGENPAVKAVSALLKQRDKLDEDIEKEKQTQAELQKEVHMCLSIKHHRVTHSHTVQQIVICMHSVLQIMIMEKKLVETRRGQASHSHKSHPRDITKAIRTTQSKLDRVNRESIEFNREIIWLIKNKYKNKHTQCVHELIWSYMIYNFSIIFFCCPCSLVLTLANRWR